MIDAKLITFLTLIEEKSYTKTATKLYITQPSVTHHIKTLERELGIELFDDPKKFILSRAGKIVYDYAQNSVKSYEKFRNSLAKGSDEATINIAITPFLADVLVNIKFFERLTRIVKSYSLYTYPYQEIIEKMMAGQIDVGIIDNSFDASMLEFINFYSPKIDLVVLNNGKFKDTKRLLRENITQNKIVLASESSGLYKSTIESLQNKNIKLNKENVLYASSTELMLEIIRSNDAIGFIYSDAIKIDNTEFKKIELQNFNNSQNAYLIFEKAGFFDDDLTNLFNLLKTLGDIENA